MKKEKPSIGADSRNKPFYLTTSIAYTNAKPHVGHAYEAVLADIIARDKRATGQEVFFLTGTDEHGSKILRKAKEEGMSAQAFVNQISEFFKVLYGKLLISNDDFIRTSDKEKHWPGAQKLWEKLVASGDLYKKNYKGFYCVGCEGFITEKELVNGLCVLHGKAPEVVEEENYFFRLSKYAKILEEKILSNELTVLPEVRKNEIISFIQEGLEDISFSRPEASVPWGVPVPNDKTHMMYVWCDALSNYITGVGYGRNEEQFNSLWPADMHIIGKDILRFHAVFWPAMLLSAELPLPKSVLVHGFILSDGKKMSKSLGNVIDPEEYINEYGAEAFRFFVAKEIPPFEDGDFTKQKFIDSYNGNLANGLGNLLSRTVAMAEKYFDGNITPHSPESVPFVKKLKSPTGDQEIEGYGVSYTIEQEIIPKYRECMDEYRIHHALDNVFVLVKELDGYIANYEPFKLIKTDKDKTEDVLWNVLLGLRTVGELIRPVMPETSALIEDIITGDIKSAEPSSFSVKPLEKPLFARITS
ncbi:MAG: methionyl-tRNA synthetase [Parcubacteria group bacterium LiPW_30]|nr:MAG: methionyl-tRNA synthetase [Parcubacteria group bacterium LiPW_30]